MAVRHARASRFISAHLRARFLLVTLFRFRLLFVRARDRPRILRSDPPLGETQPFPQLRARRLGILRARPETQSLRLRLRRAPRVAARGAQRLRHLAPRGSVRLVRERDRLGEPRGDTLELASKLRVHRSRATLLC